jgi:hypothetical protein
MKKQNLIIGTLCAIFFGATSNVNAQFDLGRKMVGLNMMYKSTEDIMGGSSNTDKNSLSIINPKFEYFFKQNISFGVGFLLINGSSERDGFSGKTKEKMSGLGLLIGSRIYSTSDSRFRFYANPQLGFSSMNQESEDFNGTVSQRKSTSKATNISATLGGGFTYMLNNHWGLDLGIGDLISFTSNTTEKKQDGSPDTDVSKSLDFSMAPIGLGSFNFGINYFF